jgi:hypothetical protein
MCIWTSLRRSPSTFPFVLDHLADAVDLVLAQILDLLEGVYIRLRQNLERAGIPNAKDVCERDACLLVARQIDASNTCHSQFLLWLCAPGLNRFARVFGSAFRGSSQALTPAN